MTEVAPPAGPPRVSPAASCIATLVAVGALVALGCVGALTWTFRSGVALQTRSARQRVEELRAEAERRLAVDALLEDIGAHLDATWHRDRAYPRALPEAPPQDPWGSALRYERAGPDRAGLRSAGPDRAFDTADDIVLTLRAE